MRKDKPTGREIAEKARNIRLDKDNSVRGMKGGKSVEFTGVKLNPLASMDELEEGQVIGVLETEIEGDETGLPVGKYNMFITKENGDWHIYAESGGEVAGKAIRVSVKRHSWGDKEVDKPRFEEEGWCLFSICLISVWGFCLLEVGVFCF